MKTRKPPSRFSPVAIGAIVAGVWVADNRKTTFDELSAKGVVFLQELPERPCGIEAVFSDDSSNWFSLTQRRCLSDSSPGGPPRELLSVAT